MIVKSIKFNSKEHEQLKQKLGNEKFSRYVKNLIFNNSTAKTKNNQIAIEQAIIYNQVSLELKRIGNNLNQIAKHCNINKSIDFFYFTRT